MVIDGAVGTIDVRELVKSAVPVMAPFQQILLEEDAKAVVYAPAIQSYRLIGPLVGESQLAPATNVGGPAAMLLAKDTVELD